MGAGRQRADEVGDGSPAEALDTATNQLAEDGRRRLRIAQCRVDGLDLDLQRLHQARQAWGLTAGKLEHQATERCRVDDGVLEGPGEAAAENPGVEGVVAVLDKDGSPGEVEKGLPGVTELRRVDEHLALDQVPPLGVGVDRRPRVDEGVEETQRAAQLEPFGADLEHEEGAVAGGLDVHRDVLGLLERRLGTDGCVVIAPLNRLPGDELGSPSGLEPEGPVFGFSHGLPS